MPPSALLKHGFELNKLYISAPFSMFHKAVPLPAEARIFSKASYVSQFSFHFIIKLPFALFKHRFEQNWLMPHIPFPCFIKLSSSLLKHGFEQSMCFNSRFHVSWNYPLSWQNTVLSKTGKCLIFCAITFFFGHREWWMVPWSTWSPLISVNITLNGTAYRDIVGDHLHVYGNNVHLCWWWAAFRKILHIATVQNRSQIGLRSINHCSNCFLLPWS